MSVYSALDAPDEVQEAYVDLLESGALPPFADAENLEHPWPELCSFSVSGGALSGILLVDRKGEGCHLAGMYVLPPYRGGTVSRALIARSLQTANALLPPETEVWTSTIDRRAFALCDELMRLGSQAVKETEFRAVYQFQGGATDADLSDKTQSS